MPPLCCRVRVGERESERRKAHSEREANLEKRKNPAMRTDQIKANRTWTLGLRQPGLDGLVTLSFLLTSILMGPAARTAVLQGVMDLRCEPRPDQRLVHNPRRARPQVRRQCRVRRRARPIPERGTPGPHPHEHGNFRGERRGPCRSAVGAGRPVRWPVTAPQRPARLVL
jgi:hypothetical protein